MISISMSVVNQLICMALSNRSKATLLSTAVSLLVIGVAFCRAEDPKNIISTTLDYSDRVPGSYSSRSVALETGSMPESWLVPAPRGIERLHGTWKIGSDTRIKVVLDVLDDSQVAMRFAFNDDIDFRDKDDVFDGKSPIQFNLGYGDGKSQTYALRFLYGIAISPQTGKKFLSVMPGNVRAGHIEVGGKRRAISICDYNADGDYSDLPHPYGQIDLDGDGSFSKHERFSSNSPINLGGNYFILNHIAPAGNEISFREAARGVIQGTVVSETGKSLSGVELNLVPHEIKAVTGRRGKFIFEAPEGGYNYLAARMDGFVPEYVRMHKIGRAHV